MRAPPVDDLQVELSRDNPHAIDVDPTFRTDRSFDLVIENHGAPLHVHLHLDDDLSRAASLATANHFIGEGTARRVTVTVQESSLPVEGKLEIVTGYGSETEYVTVAIDEPAEVPSVDVDERLGRPQPTRREPLVRAEHLPLIALGSVALLVALAAAAFLAEPIVLVGALVVLVGVAAAAALVAR